MAKAVVDNSLADLSLDFLGTFGRNEAAAAVPEAEAPAVPEPAAAEEAAGQAAIPLVANLPAEPVSAPRRHLWGLAYALRGVALALVLFCVGSLVLTLVLNPQLTFEGALALLLERVGSAAERVRGLFT